MRPPKPRLLSNSTDLTPSSRRRSAAARPAMPAPMIAIVVMPSPHSGVIRPGRRDGPEEAVTAILDARCVLRDDRDVNPGLARLRSELVVARPRDFAEPGPVEQRDVGAGRADGVLA